MALTDKRKRFIEEYTKDFNGTSAAIRAGYSEDRARVTASEILSLDEAQEYLKELRNNLAELEKEDLKLTIEIKKIILQRLKDNQNIDELALKLISEFKDDLYFMYSESLNLIKIGRSINPSSRLKAIQSEIGVTDIKIIKTLPCEGHREKEFHKKFKDSNARFDTNGKTNTEWFDFTPELMMEIWEN